MANTAGKKKRAKAKKTAAPPQSSGGIDESALTKGEIRKLNALRKSVGEKLGQETFAKWLQKKAKGEQSEPEDRNALLIADAIMALVESKGIRLPRGGYIISRGRGRVIVEAAK